MERRGYSPQPESEEEKKSTWVYELFSENQVIWYSDVQNIMKPSERKEVIESLSANQYLAKERNNPYRQEDDIMFYPNPEMQRQDE